MPLAPPSIITTIEFVLPATIPCTADCAFAIVAKGAAKVPGFESLPDGETKKFALGLGVIVIFVEEVAVESATDVAVRVTLFPLGTAEGAV